MAESAASRPRMKECHRPGEEVKVPQIINQEMITVGTNGDIRPEHLYLMRNRDQ